jgi:hypothetical protein
MIGLPTLGEGLWDLVRNLISLETLPNDKGWRFVVRRCRDAGGIGKARNALAHVARCVGASKIIMVDRDILATADHFFKLLDHAPEIKLVGAMYPLRQTPLKWVGEFLPVDAGSIGPAGEAPMQHVGTGLIRIDLEVFDEIAKRGLAPEYEYEDAGPNGSIPYGTKVADFFAMRVITDWWFGSEWQPGDRKFPRYVTEDYMISYLWRKCGGKCWTDPDCQVGHNGSVDFLQLEEDIEKRVNAALARYKADLQKVGVKVPLLFQNADGNVERA